ncbi:IucA/IucC family protein [Pseudobacteriovorax antillogorgiicola]|uniref:Aerobactin synthase n=1 Tax=Pseudobacteriovorax antillogorgiicola TaxID=1513793 RepID=A0A1Y6CWJ5_9BACT|nr:IucA/IucC family protein [Pseudobacteriovorax antillogorgiicola]TCS43617.1 aerobactin synthase [Pseudobacteriovorax antillogorgiicola]SMF80039.1 aerobactin synthase [Pseudobacteriovorax antillogorgiicola]
MRHEFDLVNRELVAKAIGELCFEQVLVARPRDKKAGQDSRVLELSSGVHYRFNSEQGIWDFFVVEPESLERFADGQWRRDINAAQFFIDCQRECDISDINLSNFISELKLNLYSDLKLLQDRKAGGKDHFDLDHLASQNRINGHPKLLVNKGRIGWEPADLSLYAPEFNPCFQLFWIAVSHDLIKSHMSPCWSQDKVISSSMDHEEAQRFHQVCREKTLSSEEFFFLPVHPWQWQNVLQTELIDWIWEGQVFPLGVFGDDYRPQVSIRTVSNITRPECPDIKLALSIMNTSCYRGIPAKYIDIAPELSQWLQSVVDSDSLLRGRVAVLKEPAACSFQHPQYETLPDGAYRLKEQLGCIWRDSVASTIDDDEEAILTACLSHIRDDRQCLGSHLIESSGLSPAEWMRLYFEVVVLPLYHLQVSYGVGLVAHGQNTILVLKENRPHRLLLKDLQGDLRFIQDEIPELDRVSGTIKSTVTRLPPEYLIHDLITGHFISVLRFLSLDLKRDIGFAEGRFYKILADVVRNYVAGHSYPERIKRMDLLRPKIERVLVNKVKFKLGYGDLQERPVPALGDDLANPLGGE